MSYVEHGMEIIWRLRRIVAFLETLDKTLMPTHYVENWDENVVQIGKLFRACDDKLVHAATDAAIK